MAGSSFSTNTSTGQSTSTSTPVQTPQSQWGLQLSQLLNAITNNQYNWAMGQYNEGKGVTNDNINQYMDLAGKGSGLAQTLLQQYQDQFKPIMDEYVRQAQTFNSADRQRFMMGQAESTVAQADTQARDEAERKLQGFGINPNSGRYQDLMLTSRIQDAAARAGAGTQAALDTADRGRAMTEKAAAFGQNVPGMAVNALQSAYTGVTGAENAILGMLNTGANITGSAAPFANAASNAIKMPTNATNAQSKNNSNGQSASTTSSPSGSDKGSGGKPQQPQGNGQQPHQQGSSPDPNRVISPKTISGPFQPGAAIKNKDDDGTGDNGQVPAEPMPYFDSKGNLTPFGDPNFARDPQGDLYTPETTPWDQLPQTQNWAPQPQDFAPVMNPPGSSPYNTEPNAQTPGGWNPNSPTSPTAPQDPFGDQNFNPQQPQSNDFTGQPFNDYNYQPQAPTNFDNQQFTNDYNYQPTDNTFDDTQVTGDDSAGGDYNDFSDYQDTASQQPTYNDNNNSDATSYDDYSGDYARGGRVPQRGGGGRGVLPTTGGDVPRSASPSRGRVTDDIPARLNAGEFVIPRDVTAHKGSEYFHRLIANSRKVRTGMAGAPARPKMKPRLPNMAPSFVSRPMGARQ